MIDHLIFGISAFAERLPFSLDSETSIQFNRLLLYPKISLLKFLPKTLSKD